MAGPIRVKGLADLNRALRVADKDVRVGVRAELRHAAEPVRADAETLAAIQISNIGIPWSRMRVGVSQGSVYVVPRKRGTKVRSRKRPNLAVKMMNEAMQPALDRNKDDVERRLNAMLYTVAAKFNR